MKKLMCGVLIVVMMLSLVACGTKLSGTYESSTGLLSYTFDGSKVTFKAGVSIASVQIEGTYKIDGDKITLTWGEKTSDQALSGEQSFEKTENGIKIGGIEFTKKK